MKCARIAGAELGESLDPHVHLRVDRFKLHSPITHDGQTQTLVEWAAEVGIGVMTLRNRLNRLRWSIERALTTPVLEPGDWDSKSRESHAHKAVTIGDTTLPIAWWARIRGLKPAAVQMRLQRGCTIEEALTPGKIKPKRGRTPRARSGYKCSQCGQTDHTAKCCNASIYAKVQHLSTPTRRSASEGGASRRSGVTSANNASDPEGVAVWDGVAESDGADALRGDTSFGRKAAKSDRHPTPLRAR